MLDPNRRARYYEARPELLERMRALGWINGCGSGWADVPDFMWEEDCDEHDFDYTVGGTESDRLDTEWRFSIRMIQRVNETYSYWNPMRFFARMMAWAYYRGVKALGELIGAWSDRERGLTMSELKQLVSEAEASRGEDSPNT